MLNLAVRKETARLQEIKLNKTRCFSILILFYNLRYGTSPNRSYLSGSRKKKGLPTFDIDRTLVCSPLDICGGHA
jgi:hypothetical protein